MTNPENSWFEDHPVLSGVILALWICIIVLYVYWAVGAI